MTAQTKSILPPPTERYTILGWLQKNLFNSWFNGLLTLLTAWLSYWMIAGVVRWAVFIAEWEVVAVNLRLFLVGQYPAEQFWRVWLMIFLATGLAGISWGIWAPTRWGRALLVAVLPVILALTPIGAEARLYLFGLTATGVIGYFAGLNFSKVLSRVMTIAWVSYFPLFLVIIRGLTEEEGWLPVVGTNLWGGLLLTFLLTVVGIVFSFPIGLVLALGRQSKLPIVRSLSVTYIELIRGIPLITVLFMAQLMLPLFIPDVSIDRILRAMVGITLFSAAYLAENVRGGLQAIPRGQYEASNALGLNGWQTTMLIILPQALRAVIPILVGQFIALFKDTTLVAVVGLLDLLGISRSVLAQPSFIGRQIEVYFFIAVIYWIFSYFMSYVSQRIEHRVGVSKR